MLAACSVEPALEMETQPDAPLSYVGSHTCGNCHVSEYERWTTSHHALAMQPATSDSVLAPFPSTFGSVSFYRRNGRYWLKENDTEHEIVRTFGAMPLQQYLIEAPRGRLQAFNIAWDSRPASDGGQRWFDLYAHDAPQPGDSMHWEGRAHNWNHMCADCHATALHKGYDMAADAFATNAAEDTVGCEACHGPGSAHAENPTQSVPAPWSASSDALVDTCAPCHSRRSQLDDGFQPGERFLDYYSPALMQPPLYTADGQIREEVYVWGSFASSRMYARGVTCGHCHDPHSATLKLAGNSLCTQCHNPGGNPDFPSLAKQSYDTPAHHFHEVGTAAAECVSCHMQEQTYMSIDDRRDHGFRPPRPDLGADIRNPCTGCHTDKTNVWATDVILKKLGSSRAENLAHALLRDDEKALSALAGSATAPSMLRATAMSRLGQGRSWASRKTVEEGLGSSDALVRFGALNSVNRLADEQRHRALHDAFSDPVKAVRIQAAQQALAMGDIQLPSDLHTEFAATQMRNADTPEAQVNLAALYARDGSDGKSIAALKQALKIEPDFVPALLNLADLLRRTGRDDEAEAYLLKATSGPVPTAHAEYALGLWLVRHARHPEALRAFERATELTPDSAEIYYAYVLSLQSEGRTAEALSSLETRIANDFADEPQLVYLAATLHRDRGEITRALQLAEQLSELGDRRGAALKAQLGTQRIQAD